MPGRYFDEWTVGERITHQPSRTVTETDNLMFSAMTHNMQPLHLDAEYARGTEFGQTLIFGQNLLPLSRHGNFYQVDPHMMEALRPRITEGLEEYKAASLKMLKESKRRYNKKQTAEMITKLEVTEAYLDDCVVAHAERKLSPIDAAKAKWWSAQVQSEVLDECVQLHGGYGFMNEYRAARAWRDARVTKIWAGTNEIMKELIGRDLGL